MHTCILSKPLLVNGSVNGSKQPIIVKIISRRSLMIMAIKKREREEAVQGVTMQSGLPE